MSKPKKVRDGEDALNLALFPPETGWSYPRELPNLAGCRYIGFDAETRDPKLGSLGPGGIRGDAKVVGISIGTDDRGWYFPLDHLGGGNMSAGDRHRFLDWLNDLVNDPSHVLVGANVLYEFEMLASLDIKITCPVIDVLVVEALLDEEADDYSLDAVAARRLDGWRKDETLLREAALAFSGSYQLDPKKDLWKLPAGYVGPYGEMDAILPLKVLKAQLPLIQSEELVQVMDLEMDLLPLLWEMRKLGVPIDTDKAKQLSLNWGAIQSDLQADMFRDYGMPFKSGYEIDFIQATCDKLNISYPLTPKTKKASITKNFIEQCDHPFMDQLRALREMDRLKGTFIDKLFFDWAINGRIHAQFKSTRTEDGGTRSGRFACVKPNLQQIPARSKLAPLIRGCFVADPGFHWAKWDYSQQEPRIMLHFAASVGCPGALEMVEYTKNNPDKKIYELIQEVAGTSYRDTKDVTLGRMYVMGAKKMAYKLGRDVASCQEVLNKFDTAHPYVKDISERMMRAAERRGYIKTVLGRRSRFLRWEPAKFREKNPDGTFKDGLPRTYSSPEEVREYHGRVGVRRAFTYKALNRSVQGSGADMVKVAMLRMWKEDRYVPYMTVHDELDGPVRDMEEALYRKQILETSIPMICPIRADLDYGDSWK